MNTPNRQSAINSAIDKECPICQSEFVLCTAVPGCGHKFCFICLKGVSISQLGGCPICRGPIDDNIFKKPQQNVNLKMDAPRSPSGSISNDKEVKQEVDEDTKPNVEKMKANIYKQSSTKMFWLYQGRRQGWWRFDPRIESEVEEAYISRMPITEVTICGQPYIIDFAKMSQYPRDNKEYAREVKRVDGNEFDTMNIKGMAGVFVPQTASFSSS